MMMFVIFLKVRLMEIKIETYYENYFWVEVYKNGQIIIRRMFTSESEAGHYAQGVENFYKFYKEK